MFSMFEGYFFLAVRAMSSSCIYMKLCAVQLMSVIACKFMQLRAIVVSCNYVQFHAISTVTIICNYMQYLQLHSIFFAI